MTNHATAPAWSDEEYAALADHRHLTAAQVGEMLGRTTGAVEKKRSKLSRGWSPSREPWSPEDLDFVRKSAGMTSAQVAAKLGTTTARVENQRKRLNLREGIHFAGPSLHPCHVGQRRLLAKTCLSCGYLLDSRRFHFAKSNGGYWTPRCMRCVNVESTVDRSKYTGGDGTAHRKRMQAITLPNASRHREPWTEADHKVLADPHLTLLEKALRLGRTYNAANSQAFRHGYRSKVGTHELDGLWVIAFPEAVRAA